MTPQDRRDLPEAIRAQLDDAARATPPADLLDAVVAEAERARQARSWWTVPRLLGGVGVAGIAVALVAGAILGVGRDDLGAPQPGYARAEQDGFVLELRVANTNVAPNEPIEAHATLTYGGTDPISRVYGGGALVLFSLEDLDGTRDVPGAMNMPCIPYPIAAGVPQDFPFAKSGGYSADDPNAGFIEAYLHDPQLRLPAGHWAIHALASFDTGDGCTAHPIALTTTVRITVGGSPSTATPQASATPAPTPSSGGVTEEEARAVALANAGSTTPVTVISARLSTYGPEADGALLMAPDAPVWAVLLSGTFQPASCGPYTATPHPCPSPATTELILIDARTGAFIQGETPAPASSLPTPSARSTSSWTPVVMPSPAAHGPFGGPQGGVAALPGGGFIDFVVEAPDRVSVYRSADGVTWRQEGEISGAGASGISGPIARRGSIYVALGTETGGVNYAPQTNEATWISTDLVHWTKAPVQEAFGGAAFTGIAAGPAAFVAIGHSQGDIADCWTSADGLHWRAVTDPAIFPPDSWVTAITWISDHFLVVGTRSGVPAAWTSSDGLTWQLQVGLPKTDATLLDGLADGPAGFVTLATGGPPQVASWITTDGVRWQPQAASAALLGANVGLVGAPGGYVAAGTVGSSDAGHLWTSTDGATWTPVDSPDLSAATELHLVSDGQHVLVFGPSSAGKAFAFVTDAVHA